MNKLIIPFFKISGLYVLIGFIVRIILLFHPETDHSFVIVDYFKFFGLGIINDFCVSLILFIFFWLYLIFFSNSKYKSPWGYIILAFFILLLGYLFCFKTIFDDYGSAIPLLVKSLVVFKAISFAFLLFIPSIRNKWRYVMYCMTFFIYVFLIIYNSVSEYLFWSEFGVRYNFIAVDYLIYTNEVIGNIVESYPVIPLFSVLILVSILITFFLVKKVKSSSFEDLPSFKIKIFSTSVYVILIIGAIFLLKFNQKQESSENSFANELQANGLYRFYEAFVNSSLSYDDFYTKMPIKDAFQIVKKEYNESNKINSKVINDSIPELRKNVVLVTIESMSYDFMSYFGNKKNITPNLDKLAENGMFFTNLYAVGNRTVRGLEAVTLCIPPSPGESIIKQEDNANLFSIGYLFKQRGYIVQYLYGGYGYFDNMGTFFEGNGYQVIDRNNFNLKEITFSNIWGVCDEDMFKKAIKTFDANYKTGKPFFGHIMTVSNHRPFTYPEGKINISSTSKSREGGVKYTDYAIGEFLKEAKKHPWYSNTVFVFIADHCASSAGKVDLPLEKYHIPAIVYSPGFIKPEKINTLTSQIDVMPTVLGQLHFSYTSHFYGQNVKDVDYEPRALIATYQNLGYYKDDKVIVLSPNRKVEQYLIDSKKESIKSKKIDKDLENEAIANYQTVSYLIENKLLKTKK